MKWLKRLLEIKEKQLELEYERTVTLKMILEVLQNVKRKM